MRKLLITIAVLIVISILGIWIVKNVNLNSNYKVGQAIDSLYGVKVYYNGAVDNVVVRNTSTDGYNLGLKYQCVEFVKRYYYERFNHKMPDSYGHAKDFYSSSIDDSTINVKRGLLQFSNPSKCKPQVEDLVIFEGSLLNRYGHVAIVSKVTEKSIEIIQQNPGPFSKSRVVYNLSQENRNWRIENESILGWLRKDTLSNNE